MGGSRLVPVPTGNRLRGGTPTTLPPPSRLPWIAASFSVLCEAQLRTEGPRPGSSSLSSGLQSVPPGATHSTTFFFRETEDKPAGALEAKDSKCLDLSPAPRRVSVPGPQPGEPLGPSAGKPVDRAAV